MRRIVSAIAAIAVVATVPAASAADFTFQSIRSITDMRSYLQAAFPLGTPESKIDAVFEGAGAAHYKHPDQKGVEKWVYDINLCRLYHWHWNISANFDAAGKLTQIFMDGEPVHAAGDPARDAAKIPPPGNGAKQAIYKVTQPPLDVSNGPQPQSYNVFDVNTSTNLESDLFIIGIGPSNADPKDFGKAHSYSAERWRSIFDEEKAKKIVDYAGPCP